MTECVNQIESGITINTDASGKKHLICEKSYI